MMRKLFLAVAALIGLFSAADAHMLRPVPFSGIGSLDDVTHQAAFAIFQTALPSRTQVNLADAPYNATCNAQAVTLTASISASSNSLQITTNQFSGGDVGKSIWVQGAGPAGGGLATTIGAVGAFSGTQTITLGATATTALVSASTRVIYGADDTAAFLAFKAAFAGSTPIQLKIPGDCTFKPTSGAGAQLFAGISDLIVQGTGPSTSAIRNIANGPWAFGSDGQGRNNSLPTNSANAGDSCVTLKTAPSITISDIQPDLPGTARFTGSASGTTLTITAVASGTLVAGAQFRQLTGNDARTFIIISAQATGTGGAPCPDPTCTGTTGTYTLTSSQTLTSQTLVTYPASFTASVDGNGVMTVSAIADGTINVGAPVFVQNNLYGNTGAQNRGITSIKSQITGSAGSTGTYQLDTQHPFSATVSSQPFHTAGRMRVTVNSTSGLSTGDTIFISGVTGTGNFGNLANGLKWIKVVDGTHLDLFQWVYGEGAYTSGGVAGGDRTSVAPIGTKVLMTGYVIQAGWSAPYGFPSNQNWFEYKTVVSVNSTTHQVCFDSPLANSYKDTWPRFNTGFNTFEVDPGGPATLYPLDPKWELTHIYKDFTLDNINWQTGSGGRNVTWNNVTMTGSNCAIPSQNETYNWIGVTGSGCSIETDKLVKTWNITNSTLTKVTVQSSSFDLINVSGSTIKQWVGGGKKLVIDNSTIACAGCSSPEAGVYVGTAAYGAPDESVITNSTIYNKITTTGDQASTTPTGACTWTMAGGVITIPNSCSWFVAVDASTELQTRYIVPGHYMHWSGSGGGGTSAQRGRAFKIVDVSGDTDNAYVTTSEAGGFPTGTWTTNGLSVRAHPAPIFTASNNTPTGTGDTNGVGLTAFNGCPAATPIFTCQNLTYTGGAAGTTPGYFPILWGEPTTFTFTNNVPYTNTGSLTWTLAQFSNWQMLTTGLTTVNLPTETINTKLPSSAGGGTRTLTSSGATGTQASDSLSAWTAGAILGGNSLSGPIFSANTPSDSPQVTVTLRTNQNLPP